MNDTKISGVVNLHKEKGYTSQDAIRVLKGILKADKVGHTGTLDPDATGVLPVCIGKATKVAEIITGADKKYRARLQFGAETDTQDASGNVLRTFTYTFDEEEVKKACASMIGTYGQVPPMYSALKKNGRKLYELARAGIEVEREPRNVTIHDLKILEMDETGLTMDVHCSKGTYIRSLCEDIGKKLGYGGYMQSLIRLSSGPYTLDKAYTLKEIETMVKAGQMERFLTDLNTLFEEYPVYRVIPKEDILLKSGNFLTYPCETIDGEDGSMVRMQLSDGYLAALYRVSEHLVLDDVPCVRLRAYKMFV